MLLPLRTALKVRNQLSFGASYSQKLPIVIAAGND